MKFFNLFILLISVLLTSCTQDNSSKQVNEPVFNNIKTLKAEVIDITPYFLNRTKDMVLIDHFLFIEDYDEKENIFHLYDTNSRKIVDNVCKRGKGPGELLYPTSNVYFNQGLNELQIFDPNMKKLTTISIKENDSLEFDINDYKLADKNGFVTEAFKLDKYFLGYSNNALSDGKRFTLFDKQMNLIKRIGIFNKPCSNISDDDWRGIMGYNSHFELKPDMSKLVIGTYIGGYIEIMDLQNPIDEFQTIYSNLIYPPIFDYMAHGNHKHIKWTSESIIGFEDIFVTNEYIYTLMSGCRGDNYTLPNRISVFDWKGKPVIQYFLDKEICSLAVDEKNGIIYATEYTEEEANLIFFKI